MELKVRSDLVVNERYGKETFVPNMVDKMGRIVEDVFDSSGFIIIDGYRYTPEMFEPVVAPEQIFTETDLVSFGSYLLSKEREERIMASNGAIPGEEAKRSVHDADIANWKDQQIDKITS